MGNHTRICMTHHFFKHGFIYRLATITSLLLWLFNLLEVVILDHYFPQTVIFLVLGALAFLVIGFALYPWYGFKYKGLGIDEHFENVAVPVVYLFLLVNILTGLDMMVLWLQVILIILFLLIIGTNLVLLYHHVRDHDSSAPACYSKG